MSMFYFIIFPRELKDLDKIAYLNFRTYTKRLLKEDFGGLLLTLRDYNNRFSFIENNSDQHVYELEGDFNEPRKREFYKSHLEILKTKFEVNYLYLVTRIQDMAHRNQLYDLINNNINSGEKVEIYSQWIYTDDPEVWGPPDNTYEIYLNDVLNNKKFYITTSSNDRYIIYKP